MKKRIFSIFTALALLFSTLPVNALAVGNSGAGGLCEHPPSHTAECGYAEGAEGTPCNHEHSEDCYALVEKCIHEHTDECYPEESVSGNTATPGNAEAQEPTECAHECSEDTGCIKEKLDCQHEHDDECGYAPATEGTPCTFVCDICGAESTEPEGTTEPEDAKCICESLCTGENVNADCPVCGVEDADLTLCKGAEPETATLSNAMQLSAGDVQKLIDELPTADELAAMSSKEQQAVYDKLQAAYNAYEALTDEQKAEVTGAEIFESLFAVFNSLISPLADEKTHNINDDGPIEIDDSCAPDCVHIITGNGQRTTNTIKVTGGTHNITIENVNISGHPAFSIESDAEVNLTLVGTNTLTSGDCCAGLQVPKGATLTIEKASSGSLTAAGGYYGAGIGGSTGKAGGHIIINGGNIIAKSGPEGGAGIGGGRSSKGGTIEINGGTVTAIGNNSFFVTADIGDGHNSSEGEQAESIFSTNGGSAVIFAKGSSIITDLSGKDDGRWNGVIFQGKDGKVYASGPDKTITIDTSFEIPAGYKLEIPEGVTLVVPDGIILTNNGEIKIENGGALVGDGTIDNKRKIINDGAISGSGTLKDNGGTIEGSGTITITNNEYVKESVVEIGVSPSTANYGETVKITARVSQAQTNSISRAAANQVEFFVGADGSKKSLGTATVNNNGAAELEITLSDGTWSKGFVIGENTITAKYGGGALLKPNNTGTATLTVSCGHTQNTNTTNDCTKSVQCSICQAEISAVQTGHTYGKWNEQDSSNHSRACTNQTITGGTCTQTETKPHSGKATCDKAQICEDCGYQMAGALGHTWGTVQYAWSDDHTSCKATRTCQNDGTHKEEADADVTSSQTKAPSCTDKGERTYTATFTSATWAAKQEKTVADVDALGHSWQSPVWSWTDYSSAKATFTCQTNTSHTHEETVKTSSETTAATCTVDGQTVHTATVTLDGQEYSDKKTETLKAPGHKYGAPDYKWSEDNKTCTATHICQTNETHIEAVTVNTSVNQIKAPTCEDPGKAIYTAAFTESWTSTQTKNADVPAIGHTWDSSDKCAVCGAETPNVTYSVAVSAPAGGSASGGGSYTKGSSVTVKADAVGGYHFVKWTEGGISVSTSSSYTFILDKDRTLVAVFEKNDDPTPPATKYNVTVSGSYSATNGAGSYEANETVTIDAGSHRGYSFNGWTVSDGVTLADANSSRTTFTMPGKDVAVTANWKYTGDGSSGGNTGGGNTGGDSGSGSGGSTIIDRPTEKHPDIPTTSETKPVKPDKDGNVTIGGDSIQDAINKATTDANKKGNKDKGIAVTVPVNNAADAGSLTITIPAGTLDKLVAAKVRRFDITTNGLPCFSFTLDTLEMLDKQSLGGDLILRLTKTTVTSKQAKEDIGTRPAYDIALVFIKDGKETPFTDWQGKTVSVKLPYTPARHEQAGNLYAVYVDANGKVEWLTKSSYNADQKAVIFEASHFSVYGVGYKNPAPVFTDITGHWAADNIIFVASRGLLAGTGNNQFSPNTGMTRGMFVTALGRLAGIDPESYKTRTFTDVKADAYYAPYVNWAAEKGIVSGTSATTFSPDINITREQMAVIMANYAKKMGYDLPVAHEAVTFADNAQISSWAAKEVKAMQQAGIMAGKGSNRFDPKGTATRAEVATVLRRFVEIVIDPQTAQGWVQDHSGSWQYMKDGKAVTGWLYDDKKWYWLDKNGRMFASGWKQISGKWYYFYSDGSMAVNTTIDGYTIGPDGARK